MRRPVHRQERRGHRRGSGGLTVAKELASYGHEVHVYDALPSGGGTTPHRRAGLPPAARRDRAGRELGRQARRRVPLQRRDRARHHPRPAARAARRGRGGHRLHVPGGDERARRGAGRRDLRRRLPEARQPRRGAVGRRSRGGRRWRLHRHGLDPDRAAAGREDQHHRLSPRAGRDGRRRGGAARDALRGREVRILRFAGRDQCG